MSMKYLSSLNFSYLKRVVSTFRIIPSLHIGGEFYHKIFPRRGNLLLYITNRCNSKCLICNHWQQQPKVDLSIDIIHDLIHSKTIGRNNWLIEGGEVFCHPDIDNILELLKQHKVSYTLFTNGIMTERIVNAIEKYEIKSVNISLDGAKYYYKKVRGVDAYDDVIKTIHAIKNKTNLQIVFTASPWNNFYEYCYVKAFCQHNNLRLMLNIYSEAAKSGRKRQEEAIDTRYACDSLSPYIHYYNSWIFNFINIPCYSSLFNIPVFPNGDVNLCVSKFSALGNLYNNSIDEIWNSPATKEKQLLNRQCNECWVSCYRYFDIKLAMMKGMMK